MSESKNILQQRFAAQDTNDLFLKLIFRPLPLSLFTFISWVVFKEWHIALFVALGIHLLEIIAIYKKWGEIFTPESPFSFYFRGICVASISGMVLIGVIAILRANRFSEIGILIAIPFAIATFFIFRAFFLATKLSRREEEVTLLSGVAIQKKDVLETYQEPIQETPIRIIAPPKFDED